jgi:hypothetical protein
MMGGAGAGVASRGARKGAALIEQSRALLWLRFTLWKRRLVQERQWGRILIALVAAAMGALFSASLCVLVIESADALRRDPAALGARGGALAIFATWLTMVLVGRVWLALISAAQGGTFLDPRRFRIYPVPARVLSALNLVALFLDPVWLFLYPPLIAVAVGVSWLPGAPSAWALVTAEIFAVWATVGVLHLGSAIGAAFDARPMLRRGFSVVLLLAGFGGFQLSIARPGRPGVAGLFAQHHWQAIAWTPPGWTAVLAEALSDHRPLHALTPALLLFLLGLVASVIAHELSLRELLRPPESAPASKSAVASKGWALPLVRSSFSALFEKEAKTVVRIGWLQLVLVPVAYLLLVRTMFSGPQPLLVAAVYAHLGVLEISTNSFGRDLVAARAYFLWPLSLREVLAAKNFVAYCFSLAIFLLLAAVAAFSARVTAGQVLVGLLAHGATFPLLATYGNATSVLFPLPVRGARLRRVRGAGPIGARLVAMAMLGGAAWAPYALASLLGLPVVVAYGGELLAMAVVYGGLLAFGTRLIESRRETLLAALAKDE